MKGGGRYVKVTINLIKMVLKLFVLTNSYSSIKYMMSSFVEGRSNSRYFPSEFLARIYIILQYESMKNVSF